MIDILNYLLALSAVFFGYHAGTDEPLKKSVR